MTTKKILVLSHAGVLEVNRTVFQELAQLGEDVVMVVPREWKGDLIRGLRFQAGDSDRSLRVIPLPVAFSGKGSLFFYRSSLRRALAGWEPELVFLDEEPWSLAALQTFLEFPRAKIVFFTKENLPKSIPWPFSSLEHWVYRRAAGAFVVSDEVERVLRGKGYRGGIQQLHHSYDPELFKARSESEKQRIKDEFGIPQNAVVIGYFGRLTADKGLPELTDALQLLTQEANLPPWFFSCVGNGPAEAQTKQALASMPPARYHVLGALSHDRVGGLLATVDILVLPSRTTRRWKEQFGRILVEAMACGAAVVGSDSGEIPHLIERSGGGLVFREGRADELAGCLVRLLRDPALLEKHRTQGRGYVEQTLTHTTVARVLAEKLQAGVSAA
ncbi:MAG TPA: glycosyltransferase [Polyangiaceae bacterium]|nr:glycosyltransferase [Polyangiaceae bacterium]